MSDRHRKLIELVESTQSPLSRPKDTDTPAPVQDVEAWLKQLRAHYSKQAPVAHPAPGDRKYVTMHEDLNAPALPAGAHEKFRRMVLR